MTKILFVCSANIDRSPTAERIYADNSELEVMSAGTLWFAHKPVSIEYIEWADVILCMKDHHKQFIEQKFSEALANKPIDYLDVEDIYPYMHPKLVEIIKEKTDRWLKEYKNKQSVQNNVNNTSLHS